MPQRALAAGVSWNALLCGVVMTAVPHARADVKFAYLVNVTFCRATTSPTPDAALSCIYGLCSEGGATLTHRSSATNPG